ncbi:hypothetical protein D3C87_1840520 [compost metagenome]
MPVISALSIIGTSENTVPVHTGFLKIGQAAKSTPPHDRRIDPEALVVQIAAIAVARELHGSSPVIRRVDEGGDPVAVIDRDDIVLYPVGGGPRRMPSPTGAVVHAEGRARAV